MLRMLVVPLVCAPHAHVAAQEDAEPATPELAGVWHAALDGPGGEIPFDLRIDVAEDGRFEPPGIFPDSLRRNGGLGREPLRVARDGDAVTLSIDPYDSHLAGELGDGGTTLVGTWRKRSGPDSWAELPFRATTKEPPFVPQKRGGLTGP